MGREVIGKKDVLQSPHLANNSEASLLRGAFKEKIPSKSDDYAARLLKYIPSEVIALYIMLDALIRSSGETNLSLYWGVFIFSIVVTPLYLWRIQKVNKKLQLSISTLAFIVWIFAIGGPFVYLSWYKPLYGGILLPIYTFLISIIEA